MKQKMFKMAYMVGRRRLFLISIQGHILTQTSLIKIEKNKILWLNTVYIG